MKSIIPDRWLDYESVGKQIGTTPFIAFKVPLKKYFFTEELSPEQKFGPSELIEKLPNLSLVIDLTNTKKYYDSNDFRENGIEYEKIFCPGHEIPRNDLIHKFFDIVDNFIKKKDKSDDMYLIGVHCTHGINRTGFFICSYMINKLGYKSENAISEFNLARGHSIERRNYLNALERYDLYPLRFPTKRARDYSYNRRKGTDNGRNESYFESNRYLRNERSQYVCDFNHPRFERGYRNHVQNSRFFPNNSYSRNEVTQNRHHRYTSLPSNSHNSREIGNPASTTTNHSPYH